ncbi:MAG: flagellar hook-basal body complex protein [Ferrovum sp.]|jgi:flagellar hook protein FlgE|nr:flagellar hook-basal body complex protein [Ferrovum sp.]NDU89409.1 flagellar hook protein FlgE [Ferrovum sp.]
MAFQQGLSGLDASASQLNTIGNNIANASTVGFKSSNTQFSDIIASAFNSASSASSGIGTQVSRISQSFTQGNIQSTGNPLDMAINGQGFFRMNNNGNITFTRNGQFQLDKNGYLVDATGNQVTGYLAASNGTIVAATPTPIQIPTANLAPTPTNQATVGVNLDSSSTVPSTTPFNPTDPTTFNNSTSMTVYDSLGNSHIATLYFVLNPPPATASWNTYLTVDGAQVPAAGTPIGTLGFNSSGTLVSPPAAPPLQMGQIAVSLPLTNGATTPQVITMSFGNSTQYGSPFGVNQLVQNGYTSGQLSGFTTSPTGIIQGNYSNGQSKNLGQIALANFADPQGLQSLGNNQWGESFSSGSALIGAPGSGNLGAIQSSAVEGSNVNLTSELVNMITAQRNYQANAQTIKTEDQITQTLINLR